MAAKRIKANAKKAAFLAAYAICGTIRGTHEATGIAPSSHYGWLESDPEYLTEFEQAQQKSIRALEEEARRRAVQGTVRLKFHPKTGEAYEELQYSDVLLIFLLKAADPAKYRDRVEQTIRGTIHHTADEMRVIVEEARRDETYVRLERERAFAAYAVAGTDGHDGQSRTLGNGRAPGAD